MTFNEPQKVFIKYTRIAFSLRNILTVFTLITLACIDFSIYCIDSYLSSNNLSQYSIESLRYIVLWVVVPHSLWSAFLMGTLIFTVGYNNYVVNHYPIPQNNGYKHLLWLMLVLTFVFALSYICILLFGKNQWVLWLIALILLIGLPIFLSYRNKNEKGWLCQYFYINHIFIMLCVFYSFLLYRSTERLLSSSSYISVFLHMLVATMVIIFLSFAFSLCGVMSEKEKTTRTGYVILFFIFLSLLVFLYTIYYCFGVIKRDYINDVGLGSYYSNIYNNDDLRKYKNILFNMHDREKDHALISKNKVGNVANKSYLPCSRKDYNKYKKPQRFFNNHENNFICAWVVLKTDKHIIISSSKKSKWLYSFALSPYRFETMIKLK